MRIATTALRSSDRLTCVVLHHAAGNCGCGRYVSQDQHIIEGPSTQSRILCAECCPIHGATRETTTDFPGFDAGA